MDTIQILPDHLINKIKAGEVLSSPFFMVKELLENSLDAGASRISLNIQDCGLLSFQIIDNGKGMSKSDLPLSIQRHATSKLSRFDQLWQLPTYGFRGEALASISSVSQMVIYSKQKSGPAHRMDVEFGEVTSLAEAQGIIQDSGTRMDVKKLFENTPVRMNFIQSRNVEKQKLLRMLQSIISSYPHVQFQVTIDDDSWPNLSEQPNIFDRILKLKKLKKEELHVEVTSYDDIKLQFFYHLTSKKIPQGDIMFNGRWTQMGKLQSLISQKLPPHHQFLLFIDLPKGQVDVNVHPNKTELHSLATPKVISLILAMLNKLFPPIKLETIDPQVLSPSSHSSMNHFCDSMTPSLMKISDRYVIWKSEDKKTYLIPTTELRQTWIQNFLKSKKTLTRDDDKIIPLLVSPTCDLGPNEVSDHQNHIPQKLEQLKKLGFDISSDGNYHFALRSIPKIFFSVPHSEWEFFLKTILCGTDLESDVKVSNLIQNFPIENILKDLDAASSLASYKLIDDAALDQWIGHGMNP
ncbi:MAG: DNA mismatch repair endonuclease MutL [Bacteriovoracaceae bacterium]|nr:DNA mismatch repair endonuclease MutL [Bacteriovoracaceae bacterium]